MDPQGAQPLTFARIVVRGIVHHWRTNLAVVLGAAVGTATLTGALFVGDSMRASLRDVALRRLGPVDESLVAQRYFREQLAAAVTPGAGTSRSAPVIMVSGNATKADSGARVNRVNVFGVDNRFWELSSPESSPAPHATDGGPAGRSVALNRALADELAAREGDDVLVRLPTQSTISAETLLGRRDRPVVTLRLTVESVLPERGLGGLSLTPSHAPPKSAFIPLATLQRAMEQPQRVNGILLSHSRGTGRGAAAGAALMELLRSSLALEDAGLRLRRDAHRGYESVESERLLMEPAAERAAYAAAEHAGLAATSVLTYLANEIAVVRPAGDLPTADGAEARSAIPYSTVSAVALAPHDRFELIDGSTLTQIPAGKVVLNEWAAAELDAQVGDRIDIAYFVTREHGALETQRATFALAGIARLNSFAADPGFAPEYRGVTDVENISDWDAPFPVDLKKVTHDDEEYWKRHRATPKAFVSLADGQRLWAHDAERFGRLTSIRVPLDPNATAADGSRFASALRKELDPAAFGLRFDPVRRRALEASSGTTDFGGLFVGFSFFLILSSAMLVMLLFRLNVERRSREAGLLLALGFPPRAVARLFLWEGAGLAAAGTLIGLVGALGYAWLMLLGLRTLWSAAAKTPTLVLAASPTHALIGLACGWLVAVASIAWSLRGLTRFSVRGLLHGAALSTPVTKQRGKGRWIVGIGAVVAAALVAAGASQGETSTQAVGFFLSGTLLLVGSVTMVSAALQRPQRKPIDSPGPTVALRLAIRNASRQMRRSTLTIGLIAAATFLIVALQAFRIDPGRAESGPATGSGGFSLFAEASVPILADLNSAEGRETLNFPAGGGNEAAFSVVPFRLSDGDETSCLNLYAPNRPRVLGAASAMIDRGGFRFGATLAETAEERRNPWLLLRRSFDDGAIPAIGDEAAVRWQLHSGLGREFLLTDEAGREVRLRFVALLRGSILQSELIVGEDQFRRLYPSRSGYSFFLIETPEPTSTSGLLERTLSSFGFDAAPVSDRLAAYAAVQNTYLSTFQLLGGLGLVLGTLGLTAVMLRNIWERRRELALMRAVGFSRATIGLIVLSENLALVGLGLLAGFVPAVFAVAPHLARDASQVPLPSMLAMVLAVLLTGGIAGVIALVPALRAPLVGSLRSE